MRLKKADFGATTLNHPAHLPDGEDAPLDYHLFRENPGGTGRFRPEGSGRQELLHRAHKGMFDGADAEFGDAREK